MARLALSQEVAMALGHEAGMQSAAAHGRAGRWATEDYQVAASTALALLEQEGGYDDDEANYTLESTASSN